MSNKNEEKNDKKDVIIIGGGDISIDVAKEIAAKSKQPPKMEVVSVKKTPPNPLEPPKPPPAVLYEKGYPVFIRQDNVFLKFLSPYELVGVTRQNENGFIYHKKFEEIETEDHRVFIKEHKRLDTKIQFILKSRFYTAMAETLTKIKKI